MLSEGFIGMMRDQIYSVHSVRAFQYIRKPCGPCI